MSVEKIREIREDIARLSKARLSGVMAKTFRSRYGKDWKIVYPSLEAEVRAQRKLEKKAIKVWEARLGNA
ncbi:hypothetical protein ES702_00456 [subsurface metagenome]